MHIYNELHLYAQTLLLSSKEFLKQLFDSICFELGIIEIWAWFKVQERICIKLSKKNLISQEDFSICGSNPP